MQLLSTTKFKKLNPRDGYLASYIQLPWGYKTDLIGRAVEIHECEGGFFLKVESGKFKQQSHLSLEIRVKNLEENVDIIKKYIQNRDGLEEIRTPDLRRVKATS